MGNIITPKEAPNWRLTLEEFSTLFHKDWVVLEEQFSPSGNGNKVVWKIQFGVYTARCWVDESGVALHTDADFVRTILLAFWYRQFVPEEIELFFYCDGNEVTQITKPFDELQVFNEVFCDSS